VVGAPGGSGGQAGGAIDGVVRDEQGAVLPGAVLTIRNVATGTARAGTQAELAARLVW